jgi:hypothetical protein
MTKNPTRHAWVEGIAFWTPRLADWPMARAVMRGDLAAPETTSARPAPLLLPANERRRAPDSVALALEVAGRACADAGADPKSLPCVFASTHGDLAVTDYMCETLAQSPTLLSPTKFHNSVHNAPAGYWTIGTGCLERYNALSAGPRTFAQALAEALVEAVAEEERVLFVAYDLEARGPLATMAISRGMVAMALVLAPADSGRTRARLDWRVRTTGSIMESAAVPANAALVAGNAMSGCMPLAEALARDGKSALTFALGPRLALDIAVEPVIM